MRLNYKKKNILNTDNYQYYPLINVKPKNRTINMDRLKHLMTNNIVVHLKSDNKPATHHGVLVSE